MATNFRCATCGASHKEPVDNCRLCGQNMAAGSVKLSELKGKEAAAPQKGMKGTGFIGVGIVAGILIVALIAGIVKLPKQLSGVQEKFAGKSDGWSVQNEDKGMFQVELPGDRTREQIDFPGTDDNKLTVWTANVGTDTQLRVGYGSIAASLPATTDTTAAAPAGVTVTTESKYARLQRLADAVVKKWMTANGLSTANTDPREAIYGGMTALSIRTTQPKMRLDGKEAFGQAVFAIQGKTLYVVQVVSVYKDLSQMDRLLNSFALTGTVA